MESDLPLVSVIVPCYNAERYMEEALASVFAQTYSSWEILIIDDGSTDGTAAIARQAARERPGQVRVLEHPDRENRGLPASRNLGVREARGEFIAPLDADDVWLPEKLERQVALLAEHPEARMIFGAPLYWHCDAAGHDEGRDHVPVLPGEPNRVVRPPELALISHPLGAGGAPCPSDLLCSRDLVLGVGGFEESFAGYRQAFEDQAFLVKVYLTAAVFVSDETWLKYRIHASSISGQARSTGSRDAAHHYYLEWLDGYLNTHSVAMPSVRTALDRALVPFRHPARTRVRRLVGRALDRVGLRKSARSAWNGFRSLPLRPGLIRFGSLRRTMPISRHWGRDRGRALDRYYIENFLQEHGADVHGRVLEVGDASYTHRFGGQRVTQSDVLHVAEGNPHATIVASLESADDIPSDSFDCIILTQTLQLVFDVQSAIAHVHRILKPGGVVLATFPGITQTGDVDWSAQWYWSFTTNSARRLFQPVFGDDNVRIRSHGNVLAATAFLYGLADTELRTGELDQHDPAYDLIITVRAMKAGATG